jgi:hypothetical protein
MKKLKYVKLFENFQDGESTFTLVPCELTGSISDDYLDFYKVKFIKMLDQSLEPEYEDLMGGDFEGLMCPATMEVEIIEARYFCGYDGKSTDISPSDQESAVTGKRLHLRCDHDGQWQPGSKAKLDIKLKFCYNHKGEKIMNPSGFNNFPDVQVETKEDLKKIFDILETEIPFFTEESKDYDMFTNSINSVVLRK